MEGWGYTLTEGEYFIFFQSGFSNIPIRTDLTVTVKKARLHWYQNEIKVIYDKYGFIIIMHLVPGKYKPI